MNPLLAREFVAPLRLGNSPHEHAERLASLGPREWEAALDWLDLAGNTRSVDGSALTEEFAAFLNRYGIRLPRVG